MEKSYGNRIKNFRNETARKLFVIMEEKKSNLSIAMDVVTKKELLCLANLLGPFICCLKVSYMMSLKYE